MSPLLGHLQKSGPVVKIGMSDVVVYSGISDSVVYRAIRFSVVPISKSGSRCISAGVRIAETAELAVRTSAAILRYEAVTTEAAVRTMATDRLIDALATVFAVS